MSKSIYVYCNDPSRKVVTLTVMADVQNGIPVKTMNESRPGIKESPRNSDSLILDLLGIKP
jgi:hypothetical protein